MAINRPLAMNWISQFRLSAYLFQYNSLLPQCNEIPTSNLLRRIIGALLDPDSRIKLLAVVAIDTGVRENA